MPAQLDKGRLGQPRADEIVIGLVNNMPDSALEATERQFLNIMHAASGDTPVRLNLFALRGVPRGEAGRQRIMRLYADVAEMRETRIDGLIVTGAEPRFSEVLTALLERIEQEEVG